MDGICWLVFIATSQRAEPRIEYMIIHNRTQSDEGCPRVLKGLLMLQKIRPPRVAGITVGKLA